jgi:stage III sporulation protein AB
VLKFIGATLLTLAGAMGGYEVLSRRQESCNYLEEFILALGVLRSEIMVNLTPLPEAARLLWEQGPIRTRAFFGAFFHGLQGLGEHSLREIWAASLLEMAPQITGQERAWVLGLGHSLGAYDGTAQGIALDRCIENLEESAARLRNELRQSRRVYLGLGMGAGMLAAALLI